MQKNTPKKNNIMPILMLIVLVAAIVTVLVFILKPNDSATNVQQTEETEQTPALTSEDLQRNAQLAEALGAEDGQLEALSETERVVVTDLSVNESLPQDWMNILLLGSDERTAGMSARTDAMVICSINTNTGEVKLTSIMRDTAVDYTGFGTLNGIYRINAANYFGGEALAMKLVNELFGMNITSYVHVDFFGFQQIVQQLGGVDVNVTKAEMEEINVRIVEQARYAYDQGITEDRENIPYEFLERYGENTHLDGRMALAYTRLRHVDSEYSRTERQRTVLTKLLAKVKVMNNAERLSLGLTAMPYVRTNMTLDQMLQVAMTVCSSGFDANNVQTMRLPVNNTYVQERRDGQSMLYDVQWAQNAAELYNFIYGI